MRSNRLGLIGLKEECIYRSINQYLLLDYTHKCYWLCCCTITVNNPWTVICKPIFMTDQTFHRNRLMGKFFSGRKEYKYRSATNVIQSYWSCLSGMNCHFSSSLQAWFVKIYWNIFLSDCCLTLLNLFLVTCLLLKVNKAKNQQSWRPKVVVGEQITQIQHQNSKKYTNSAKLNKYINTKLK